MTDKRDSNEGERILESAFKMPIIRQQCAVKTSKPTAFTEAEDATKASVDSSSVKKEVQDIKKEIQDRENGQNDADSKPSTDNDTANKVTIKQESFSPAERLKEAESPVPYKEPSWGGVSIQEYFFESIKNGTVLDKVSLTSKSFFVFGRLPSCDHSMDHPSLSRYHTVIQHRSVAEEGEPVGWYLYDLDSTHGTWINKQKVKPRVYYRLRVGYVVKFGGSTRLFILHGPDSDQDEESQLSVSELKQQRDRQKKEAEVLRHMEIMAEEEAIRQKQLAEQDKGCSWGMAIDDAVEEEDEDDDVNPFAVVESSNEDVYSKDPKKSLLGFFEREGYGEPEYEFQDEGKGRHRCGVKLPIETSSGDPVYVEVLQEGKKKDAMVACALQACRLLDRKGLLCQAKHESRARKKRNWEEADFYDSDEDIFLDRTGDIEKKRAKRIKQTKKVTETVETYESLTSKLDEVSMEMNLIEEQLEKDKAEKESSVNEGLDELDAFMKSINAGGLDTKKRITMKHRLITLKQEKLRLERLIAVAKPCQIVLAPTVGQEKKTSTTTSIKPQIFGKIKGGTGTKHTISVQRILPSSLPTNDVNINVVEEEEEDESEEAPTRMQEPKIMDCGTSSENNDVLASCDKITRENKVEATAFVKGVAATVSSERKKSQTKQKSSNKHRFPTDYSYEDDDKYATWVPPTNQTGDGRTNLNDKLGY